MPNSPLRLSEPGPLLTYLSHLQTASGGKFKADHKEIYEAIRAMLATREGAIFLDLLDKSIVQTPLPILADIRALAARNAQSFILSDLRRIASNELELQQNAGLASRGRRNASRSAD